MGQTSSGGQPWRLEMWNFSFSLIELCTHRTTMAEATLSSSPRGNYRLDAGTQGGVGATQ